MPRGLQVIGQLKRARQLDVDVTGLKLVVTGDEIAVVDAVRDTCASLGVGIRRLQRRTATLEDVFLAAGTTT